MRAGILFLNLFAAAWACAALGSLGAPDWTWLAPVLVSAGVLTVCWRAARTAPAPPDAARRIARVVGFWSAVEGLLIAVAVAAMVRLDAERLIGPLVGIIVGLHFAALAKGLPLRSYYATGLGLIAVSMAALFFPGRLPLTVTGFGAALVLWSTSVRIGFR